MKSVSRLYSLWCWTAAVFITHNAVSVGQEVESSLSGTCEDMEQSGSVVHRACLTEAQQLFRSRNVAKALYVSPEDGTCGDPPSQYCRLEFSDLDCGWTCNSSDPSMAHSPTSAVDSQPDTWWQSVSWLNYPTPLLITYSISFRKLYRLTDNIVLTFNSGRPRELMLERSTDGGQTWSVWQLYAKDCLSTFGVASEMYDGTNSQSVTCSQMYSDILPYTGGQVVFDVVSRYRTYLGTELSNVSHLYQSYNDTNWQRFLQFTDIRLTLLHPATDGEEVNGGFNLLKYYYAISDIDVTAECSCNLHASVCHIEDGSTVCDCQHNTAGVNCERCLPLFNNRVWLPGYYVPLGNEPANECQECQCHGHADSCVYAAALGHGECVDCRDNTGGPYCDQCVAGFYINSSLPLNSTLLCVDCGCHTLGTLDGDTRCDGAGVCTCKNNVKGDKCSGCVEHYYGLNTLGDCHVCNCSEFGVVPGSICDEISGQCECKNTTEARTCSRCKDTYYNFPTDSDQECLLCDCVPGASANIRCDSLTGQCDCLPNISGRICDTVIPGFYLPSPLTEFKESWSNCSTLYEVQAADVAVNQRYHGARVVSCGEGETTQYTVTVSHHPSVVLRDYLLGIRFKSEGNTTLSVTVKPERGCSNSSSHTFSLHVSESVEWDLSLSDSLLRLSAGCDYTLLVVNQLSQLVSIDTLVLAADWSQFDLIETAERMQCYDWLNSGLDDPICEWIIHSGMSALYLSTQECFCDIAGTISNTTCDPYGGQCQCKRGVKGRSCDQCITGFHSLTTLGCRACDCDVIGSGHSVCDPETGQCSCKELVATNQQMDQFGSLGSKRCEFCIFGSYNLSASGCISCKCNSTGSWVEQCNINTGECQCKSGVGGAYCDQCHDGFYGFSQSGCRRCGCDEAGSSALSCDKQTGQCLCRSNAVGRTCTLCTQGTFGLSNVNTAGCSPCYCSNHGVGVCQPAQGYFQARLYYEELTSSDGYNLSLRSLLPSYGSLLTVFVMSADTNNPADSVVVSLVSTSGKFTVTLHHTLTQPLTARVKVPVVIPLIESEWRVSGGLQSASQSDSPDQLTFLHVLEQNPIIRLEMTLVYTALSITIATTEEMMSSNQPHYGSENCSCSATSNTQGLSCEECIPGYKRAQPSLGSLSACVPCQCSGRTDGPPSCDPDTGVCLNCRIGSSGDDCGSCDHNVTGSECSACDDGFWGLRSLGACVACDCDNVGAVNSTCDQLTGRCHCKQNVGGVKCNTCLLNYQVLGVNGCTECHECYSFVGDKLEELFQITEELNATHSQVLDIQPKQTNLTFTESVQRVSGQLTTLTSELLSLAEQESAILSSLSPWQSLLSNSSLSDNLREDLAIWNRSLSRVNSSLSQYEELGDWVQATLTSQTMHIDGFAQKLTNQSAHVFEEKLSLLDDLIILASNVTNSLETEVSDLTALLLIIDSLLAAADNITANLTLTLDSIRELQENTTFTANLISDGVAQDGERLSALNQTLQQMDNFVTTINQSVMSLQNNRPIRDVIAVYNNSESMKTKAETATEQTRAVTNSLRNVSNQTSVYEAVIDRLFNQSAQLSAATGRHLVAMQMLYDEITLSSQSLMGDFTYLTDINEVLGDFHQRLSDVETVITNALSTLSDIRNTSLVLATVAESVIHQTTRAQWQAEQSYIISNDIYTNTTLQLQRLMALNQTVSNLIRQAESLPSEEYVEKMSTVLRHIVELHNDTCTISLADLEMLKNRYMAADQEADIQSQQAADLSSQVSSTELLLQMLESVDHQSVQDLAREVESLSGDDPLALDPWIDMMERRVVTQRNAIASAEKRLSGIQRAMDEL